MKSLGTFSDRELSGSEIVLRRHVLRPNVAESLKPLEYLLTDLFGIGLGAPQEEGIDRRIHRGVVGHELFDRPELQPYSSTFAMRSLFEF